jgi:hypothetical protein
LHGDPGGYWGWSHDDIGPERDQFGRESRQRLSVALGTPNFDDKVATLDVTKVTQCLPEGFQEMGISAQLAQGQEAYPSDPDRLLRVGRERRGE